MPAQWISGTIGVPAGGPASVTRAIFLNTSTGVGVDVWPDSGVPGSNGPWRTVDVSELVPEGTKAIRLDGLLIISHGSISGTADLAVGFRAMGETADYSYVLQTIEAESGQGVRSNAGTWIALDENRQFEFRWQRTLPGTWPTYPAYGINLRITAIIS